MPTSRPIQLYAHFFGNGPLCFYKHRVVFVLHAYTLSHVSLFDLMLFPMCYIRCSCAYACVLTLHFSRVRWYACMFICLLCICVCLCVPRCCCRRVLCTRAKYPLNSQFLLQRIMWNKKRAYAGSFNTFSIILPFVSHFLTLSYFIFVSFFCRLTVIK